MLDQVKSKFMSWYYSNTELARLARNTYRSVYHTLAGPGATPARILVEYDPRRFIVLDDRELIYIEISKAGTTSIKSTIGRSYGFAVEHEFDIHHQNWHCEIGKLRPSQERFYKFAFVRNPFSRLVSCYVDRILHRGETNARTYLPAPFCLFPTDIGFAEFVHRIARIPDRRSDRHIRSQYSILYRHGKLIADWIGRLESIERDWSELALRFKLSPIVEHRHRQGLCKDYRSFYTRELADLVYKRYRRDFETFGYSGAYHELLAYIKERGERG